jgi:hypothetical protein
LEVIFSVSDIVTLVTDGDNIICLLSSKIEEVRSPVKVINLREQANLPPARVAPPNP